MSTYELGFAKKPRPKSCGVGVSRGTLKSHTKHLKNVVCEGVVKVLQRLFPRANGKGTVG
jgi:hypothetical protein